MLKKTVLRRVLANSGCFIGVGTLHSVATVPVTSTSAHNHFTFSAVGRQPRSSGAAHVGNVLRASIGWRERCLTWNVA
jgi:hypothetical protein